MEYSNDKLRILKSYDASYKATKDTIKLNTNENPFPPPRKVLRAIKKEANKMLRRYPDNNATLLKEKIADRHSVETNQISVANGSDEILAFIFMAFFNRDSEIVFPEVTYHFYKTYADLFEIPFRKIKMFNNLDVNPYDLVSDNGIILANPNPPVGSLMSYHNIEKILINNPSAVVVVDEAYSDFCSYSSQRLIDKYDNLIIVKTLSKSKALAGLRVGYALADRKLIEALEIIKDSYNPFTVDRLALAGAAASFDCNRYYDKITKKIIKIRDKYKYKFKELGFEVLHSNTNFLFMSHHKFYASTIFKYLLSKNILVRHFNHEPINNYLRISIGTEKEMKILYKELKELVKFADIVR